jgi:proline dehydrogenase
MILRNTLLFLSRQSWLQGPLARSRVTRRLVARFIAGETLEQALTVVRRLKSEGILATLDHLGEHVTTLEAAEASARDALEALERSRREGLETTVSIKLTQFGLDVSPADCARLAGQLVEAARRLGTVVEIDMESSAHTDATLGLVERLHRQSGNIRAVVQAYLYRTEADVARLCEAGVPVRLCKGAYREPASVAFPRKRDVDANYRKLASFLLGNGVDPAFATHDESIIREIASLARQRGLSPRSFEFQMLYGIRRDLQRELVAEGYRLRLYVPYGCAWYPYFMRRLAERPANLLFLLRALFQR